MGTNISEINKIRAFGTIELQNPTKFHHKAGTKISQRTSDVTTKKPSSTGPCGEVITTTTTPSPCGTVATTTVKNPCAVVKKFDMPSETSQKTQVNALGLLGWGVGGFAGVAMAVLAMRGVARSRTSMRSPYHYLEEAR